MKKRFSFAIILCLHIIYTFAQTDDVQNLIERYDYHAALQLLEKEPETPEKIRLKALCYEKIYAYDKAVAAYEKLFDTQPDDLEIVVLLAETTYKAGDAETSLNYWTRACELAPDNLFLQTKKAVAHYRAEDWKGTLTACNNVLEQDTVPMLLRMMGDACLRLNNGLGISYYQKAIEKNPADYRAVLNLCNFFYAVEAYDSVINRTNDYLKTINRDHKAIGQLNGMALYSAGKYSDAVIRLSNNTRLGDSTYTTCYFLGMSYFAGKIYFRATQWLEKAYQQDSTDLNLMYYYGTSLVNTYHKQRGIRILQRGIDKINKQQEKIPDFEFSLGIGYLRMQAYRKSIAYFKKVRASKPKNTSILYNIGFAYDALEDYPNAIKYYKQFLETETPASDNEDTSGTVRTRMYKAVSERIDELHKEQFFKGE